MQEKTKSKFRFSIRVKTISMILLFALVLSEIAMVYFSVVSSNSNQRTYKEKAKNIAATIAEVIDADKFYNLKEKVEDIVEHSEYKLTYEQRNDPRYQSYIDQFKDIMPNPEVPGSGDADYVYLRKYLQDLQAVNSDEVSCMYLVYVDDDLKSEVYVVDNSVEDNWSPGTIDALSGDQLDVLTNPDEGLVPMITNEPHYGYLCTAGAPVYHIINVGGEDKSEIVGYIVCEFSMSVVRSKQADNIVRLFIYLMITAVLISIVGITIVHFSLIHPINQLINATKSYDINDPEKTHEIFAKIDIKNHDEIADLAEALKTMEHDIHLKIIELQDSNRRLSESQALASKMTELATRDGLTGVRNKTAYDSEVAKIDNAILNNTVDKFGIVMIDLNYLKTINDDYGHNSGDAALIKLCNVICTIFAHSPVYRIGGDEFVVILRNIDYERSTKLIKEFNTKIQELSIDEYLAPAERISAAIGYSIFDKEKDKCVDDVFKRADQEMYLKKRRMKGEE